MKVEKSALIQTIEQRKQPVPVGKFSSNVRVEAETLTTETEMLLTEINREKHLRYLHGSVSCDNAVEQK